MITIAPINIRNRKVKDSGSCNQKKPSCKSTIDLGNILVPTRRESWHTVNINDPDNKQLLDEVEHDIMNYQNRGLCYLPKPKAEADNTDTRF